MKRLFVAVAFDSSFKEYIHEIQTDVKLAADKGKFHPKDNFHLTIEFIGMVPDKLIEPLWQSIIGRLEWLEPFYIQATHLNFFNKKNKKIPWIGFDAPDLLNRLQKEVALGVADVIEHVSEHHYTPHVTLGRQVVIQNLPNRKVDWTFQVKEICLMESSSATGALKYTPIRRYSFN